jgi:DHA3 family tetracycline resistance protein-like MFS transporter
LKKLSASTVYLTESFVFAFAFRLAFTTYVIYRVRVLGLDPLQLVLAGTVLESTVFLFEIPTGIVADLYSRRLSTIIGFFCFGFGILIEGLAPLFSVLLFSQVVTGLGWTFTSGAYSAWITDEVGTDKVGQLFLRGSQLDNIGSLLAILPAIWIASYDLALPFLLGGGLLIAVAP